MTANDKWKEVAERVNRLEVGQRIENLYSTAGMNRNQFAKAVGVDYGTVLGWERGLKMPGGENLFVMAKVLGTTTDHILQGDAAPSRNNWHPDYDKVAQAAWKSFLTDPIASLFSPVELEEIREIRFRAGAPSSAEFYRHIAMAKLQHRAGKDIAEALDADDVTPDHKPGDPLTVDPATVPVRSRRTRK